MITFHPNEACLIELETLKCSQMKSINEFLPVEATRLCRHGIAANFNTAEETGFICVAEISSDDVEKVDHKSVKKSEKESTPIEDEIRNNEQSVTANHSEAKVQPACRDDEQMIVGLDEAPLGEP